MKVKEHGDGDYYLGVFVQPTKSTPAKMEWTKKLSHEEAMSYMKAETNLKYWLLHDREAFGLLEHSYDVFLNTVEAMRMKLQTIKYLPNGRDELLSINSAFMSFLSMRHFYLDRTRVTISSKRPDLMKAHELATNHEFNTCFAFKFCSQLRNYAQHAGLPITGLQASGAYNPLEKSATFKFQLNFLKTELLARKSIWKASVRPDLEAMPERFPVLPLANELMHAMDRIRTKTLKEYKPYFEADLKIVDDAYKATITRKGIPCIFWGKDVKLESAKADLEMSKIPTELIEIGKQA